MGINLKIMSHEYWLKNLQFVTTLYVFSEYKKPVNDNSEIFHENT